MICDNCIHNAVCERAHFENHCGYKHTEADVINPELEKIKQEMIPNSDDFWRVANASPFIKIIDKHIAELKGEKYEPDDWDSLANAERDH